MKPSTLTIGLIAILPLFTFAQDPVERPAKGEFFERILETVDESQAAELQAQRDELTALRDEVKALRDADDADEETLQAAIDNLRLEGKSFRADIRGVIDGNEDLQAALAEARENADFDGRPPRPHSRHRHGESE